MKPNKIMEDGRPIKGVVFSDGEKTIVGENSIVEIVPYEENGQSAPVTWLAIYVYVDAPSEPALKFRVPADKVVVVYDQEGS